MEQLFSWGKLKTSGDNQMYPVQDQNMTGAARSGRSHAAEEFTDTASWHSQLGWGLCLREVNSWYRAPGKDIMSWMSR